MTYRVEINDCLSQFHCAHEALIASLGGSHNIAQTNRFIKREWQKRYNITPVRDANSIWKYLDFESEQHYSVFILKWS
jgi:hypothetical protein